MTWNQGLSYRRLQFEELTATWGQGSAEELKSVEAVEDQEEKI